MMQHPSLSRGMVVSIVYYTSRYFCCTMFKNKHYIYTSVRVCHCVDIYTAENDFDGDHTHSHPLFISESDSFRDICERLVSACLCGARVASLGSLIYPSGMTWFCAFRCLQCHLYYKRRGSCSTSRVSLCSLSLLQVDLSSSCVFLWLLLGKSKVL